MAQTVDEYRAAERKTDKARIAELEAIVDRQGNMLHNLASEAGFADGEAYTWIAIANRLRQQGRK